jgi:transcriptional regulator with XRE-family HTH domain
MDHELLSPRDICEAVGRRAKERRLAMVLRQVDVAEHTGVPLSTVKRFENEGRGSLETVVRIAFVLRAEREFSALFPRYESRTLDEILAANRLRQRARGPSRSRRRT